MARKNTATTNTAAAASTSAESATPGKKGGRPPGEPVLYWTGAKDKVLINLLLSKPGQWSSQSLLAALAQDSNFAADVAEGLLANTPQRQESLRQRVRKIGKGAAERGASDPGHRLHALTLGLSGGSGSGYSVKNTLDVLFHEAAQAAPVVAAQAVVPAVAVVPAAPVASGPLPTLPTLPPLISG